MIHMGGFPFFGYTQMMTLYPTTLLSFLIRDIEPLLNIIVLLTFFFAGFFMYFVMNKFGFDQKISFVGALFFTFNGFARWMSLGWLGRFNAYIWYPLIFLCVWKSLYSKKWLKYSLLAGLFLGLQYYSSGVNIFIYSIILVGVVYIIFMINKYFTKRLTKVVIVSLLIIAVLFGLISFQLIPLFEFARVSSQQGFTFEQAIGKHVQIDSVWDVIQVFVWQFPGHHHHSAMRFCGV